ncbi:YdcF family protein [Gordonia sp. CPCC 206044]|uniref:YdcF family protein n=1 Tax=Gordonia sp. CPCC 206044 TaxID=3140793 RepID=UPI003AF3B033
MRLRLLVTLTAVVAVLATGFGAGDSLAAPARKSVDMPIIDTGSTAGEQLAPNSIFLWQNPGARYIVVLGAQMGKFGQTPQILNQRLNTASKLGKQHPFNRMIVSGGNTWWLPVSEAQFMNVGLLRRGVPPWQMVNEGKSTSTVQNASYTVGMLKAMGANGALIVTNGFHMPRAIKDFRDAAAKQGARIEFRPAYA